MKAKVGLESPEAEKRIPPAKPDGSGVGVNYADAYVKEIKATLEDGRKVTCKRRGLKLTLTVGDRRGEGLLRRLEHGPDVKTILREALKEAAREAGATFLVEDGVIYLDIND
jgi:hypothetical protein